MAYTYGTDEWLQAYDRVVAERQESESPPYLMGSPEWLAVFEGNIKADAEYRDSAKDWEGTVVLHCLAEPELGLDDDLYLFADLWHGDCRSFRLVPKEVGEAGDHVLTGEYGKWKSVLIKDLDVVKALMQGKISLRGDLRYLLRYAKAAKRLVDIAPEASFPDQMTSAEIEGFRSWILETRSDFGV
jgi:putative sterol carrier protein